MRLFQPKLAALKDYVAYYYFMSAKEHTRTDFSYYPHYNATLNLFSNANVLLGDVYQVNHAANAGHTAVFTCGGSHFKKAQILGSYDIVGIVFKPLGANHFIDIPSINKENFLEFKIELAFPDSESNLGTILFQEEDEIKRVNILDDFFSRTKRSFHMPKLASIVKAIIDTEGMIEVQELEKRFQTNRRTMLRWFRKYLFCSLTEMKNIVKFRTAIAKYQASHPKMSELSYESNYYDQSDFIKHFKSLTGELPKQLLEHIKEQKEQSHFWKFTNL